MLLPLDEMFTAARAPVAAAAPLGNLTWMAIPEFLKAEIAAGEPESSRKKARTAVNGLLKARKLTAENAYINLDWFDRTFPVLTGWDPLMDIEPGTWVDYVYRVRPIIERMTGADVAKQELRAAVDGWTDLGEYLRGLDAFQDFGPSKRLIPICSTLTQAARRARLQPQGIDQAQLLKLYDEAHKGEISSLRKASELIAELQSTTPSIRAWFPSAIVPIEACGPHRYEVPAQLQAEVEHFVELASRKRYIRVKKRHDYVEDGTRTNFRTTMHAVVDGLIAVGRLRRNANGFSNALEDPEALDDLVSHTLERVERRDISARSATSLMARLPVILDRNGLSSEYLRAALKEVDELQQHPEKVGMSPAARRFCTKLLASRKHKNRLLLAHAKPRAIAQRVLDAAAREGRALTRDERSIVISHGVVATFCSVEVGGAPLRTENFLEMPYGVLDAWIHRMGKGFQVTIPAGCTKNGEPIDFEMMPTIHKWCETVDWYLEHVRPLILKDADTGEVRSSPWLVPMLSDQARPCPYETFHDWFVPIMRDVNKLPCLPHNFRHGQASLLYQKHPDRIAWIARRLGDKESTVLLYYAWVNQKQVMKEGQELVIALLED